MTEPATAALILDVDGVVSPIHGPTAWGDDQIAGYLSEPVLVSPTLTRRLDSLAGRPDVTAAWLTGWPASARRRLLGFPGRDWPDIGLTPTGRLTNDTGAWWKPAVLRDWLDSSGPQVRRLVWCDDYIVPNLAHLSPLTAGGNGQDEPPFVASPTLETTLGATAALLIAPATNLGLTPTDLDRIENFIGLTARP